MVRKRKGIILAGGTGCRLYPSTMSVSKQLLPIYDKPMVYYPLTTLIQSEINDILIITNPHFVWHYRELFKDAHELGLNIEVAMQPEAGGIPQAFTIGEKFIGGDDVCLILGDNFYYGGFMPTGVHATQATIFAYKVHDPSAYGVLEFDKGDIKGIVEKPTEYISPWAVTGLYFYPNDVVEIAKTLKPSGRGELEITDVNQHYCDQDNLRAEFMARESVWLDCGTHDALADATSYVRTVEARTGFKVGCYEEAALNYGFAELEGIEKAAAKVGGAYGEYLRTFLG